MATYTETVYWLTLIYESGLKLNLIKPIIQRWCLTEEHPLAGLFNLPPEDWVAMFGLAEKEASQALLARDKLARQAEVLARWQAQGIETLVRTDPRYPQRLAATLPPSVQPLILWARGALGLLQEPGVAMLGSQEPDASTTNLIQELVEALVTEGVGLVSGYGRGLDRATFEAITNTAAGHAVAVLPMGLNAFAKTTHKLDRLVEAGRVVLLTPFSPETPFQERLAEARNLLIDHMALVLLVPQADDDSLQRASAALGRGIPIFVDLTDTANNRALIDQGALLLTDAGEVVELVQQAIIDAVLLEPTNEEGAVDALAVSASSSSLTSPPFAADTNNDFALRTDDVEPIDRDEALEILSMGGKVPDVLRKRLQQEDEEQ